MTTRPLLSEGGPEATVSVVICALNEAENLPHVLPRLPSWVDEVVFVDGYSSDATVEVARRLRPDARILYQPAPGKGIALRCGVEAARGDIIVTIDADGETDPQDLPRFIEPLLAGHDLAKGSRFAEGWRNKPLHRLFGNWAIVTVCNLLYGTRFTDLCSGYTALWRRCLQSVDFWSEDGWNFEPLIVARALKAGLKVVEVPQTFSGRRSGESKLPNLYQGFKALRVLVRERLSP